jgi:hypothetical protein
MRLDPLPVKPVISVVDLGSMPPPRGTTTSRAWT